MATQVIHTNSSDTRTHLVELLIQACASAKVQFFSNGNVCPQYAIHHAGLGLQMQKKSYSNSNKT